MIATPFERQQCRCCHGDVVLKKETCMHDDSCRCGVPSGILCKDCENIASTSYSTQEKPLPFRVLLESKNGNSLNANLSEVLPDHVVIRVR